MKKQQHFKIISTILILAFALGVLTCGEEDSGDLGLIWIPPGTFEMGSLTTETGHQANEEPQHWVTLKGFYMSRYPITQSQYYLVTGEKPSRFNDDDGRGRLPVEYANWFEAIVFCNKLSIKHGLQPVYSISKITIPIEKSTNPTDWGDVPTSLSHPNYDTWNEVEPNWNANGYRLPTEAEWEYACRAGETAPYNNKWDGVTHANAPGWYIDSIINGGPIDRTQEVGLKPPNAWGLYDMPGNVWEWCWDWYDDNYYSKLEASDNPKGPPTIPLVTPRRVRRGGSLLNDESYMRSACRGYNFPSNKTNGIGLRVVRP